MPAWKFVLFGYSILPPVLAAGAILRTFISWQYWWDRRKRRKLRHALESNPSKPFSQSLPDAPPPVPRDANQASSPRGLGTSPDEAESFPAFGEYFLDHLGRYGVAVLFVCIALLVRLLLEPVLRGHVSYGFFLLAVVATALVADLWETFLALVLGFLMAVYFFVEPPGFKIGGPDGWFGALIYFTTGLGILWFMKSEHTAWLRTLDRDIAYFDRLKELEQERAARNRPRSDRDLLASIVDSAQDPIFSVTLQGRITSWNAAAERLFGYSALEAIGQPLAFMAPPDHRAQPQHLLDQINHGQRTEQWQTALSCKGGSSTEVSLTFSPVNDRSGRLIGASVIVRPNSPKQPAG